METIMKYNCRIRPRHYAIKEAMYRAIFTARSEAGVGFSEDHPIVREITKIITQPIEYRDADGSTTNIGEALEAYEDALLKTRLRGEDGADSESTEAIMTTLHFVTSVRYAVEAILKKHVKIRNPYGGIRSCGMRHCSAQNYKSIYGDSSHTRIEPIIEIEFGGMVISCCKECLQLLRESIDVGMDFMTINPGAFLHTTGRDSDVDK